MAATVKAFALWSSDVNKFSVDSLVSFVSSGETVNGRVVAAAGTSYSVQSSGFGERLLTLSLFASELTSVAETDW